MGGIDGYYGWVEALGDPAHEMHVNAIERLGEDFDLARFDLEEAKLASSNRFPSGPEWRGRSGRKNRVDPNR